MKVSIKLFQKRAGFGGLVGQSYKDVRRYVDIFSPMIYRNYNPSGSAGPACLNHELASIGKHFFSSFDDTHVGVELISSLTGINLQGYRNMDDIKRGLPVSSLALETRKAKAFMGRNNLLVPIIVLDDHQLDQAIEAVSKEGADGINFFAYNKEIFQKRMKLLEQTI